ncbi:MAG TPA: PEGA domain-containing protein [Bryobacteraceae bacterium]|nr:PEGA domain-containing protein [Bryobacteraceae bacterium]
MSTKKTGARLAAGLLFVAASLAFGQQTGNLKVKTTTGRAGVFVDDKYVGPAANFGMSRTYAVPAGEHTITLRDPRYEPATTHVTVVAGKTVNVKQDLKPLPPPQGPFGRLRTQGGDKYWAVYVNGAYMGHVDEFDNFAQGLLLPAGQYSVKIVPPNGGPATEENVDLKANQTTIVRVKGKA